MLAARELGGLAEDERHALRIELVERVAYARIRADAGRRVGLAALGGDPEVLERPLLPPELGSPLHVLLGRLRGALHRLEIAMPFDAEEGHRLPGGGDAVGDALCPAVLDADDDGCSDVRIRAGADQRAEVKLEVGAELQASVRVEHRERAFDVVLDGLRRRIGKVVDGQDDDVAAYTDAAVLAHVAGEACFRKIHGYQRFVFRLCTCTCSPLAMGFTTRPISTPYLMTVSPSRWSRSASLWPIGRSFFATTSTSLSCSMIQPLTCWPAWIPSTTTTPTPSPSSCTTK